MTIQEPILVVGYTARMLAELGARAGYRVTALDYFGDSDLRATCPGVSLLRDFAGKAYNPRALAAAAADIDARAVVYGASFENHPALVARLAAGRQLLGNTPETLARARDPFELQHALRAAGFAFPKTLRAGEAADARAGTWLWKPERGGGGSGVRWAGRGKSDTAVAQEFIAGMPCSFTFVAAGGRARVIGLSEQLIGLPEFGANGFHWCGNLTPPRAAAVELAAMAAEADAIAAHLAEVFNLRGLNTVDFMWRAGRIWTLEINARPSASMELYDRVRDRRMFDLHVRACAGEHIDALAAASAGASGAPRAAGKAVVFATRDARVGESGGWRDRDIRDIPHAGETIAQGHPICTVLVEAHTPERCFAQLLEKADWVRQQLATAG